MKEVIPAEIIEKKIYLIRKQKVMLDSDLSILYDVETSNLNKAVKRNIDRFPEDFMFRLTKEETDSLTFQSGISKRTGRGGRRYLPYAFTEQGIAMLSCVLHSKRAIHANIAIMRAFVKLREVLSAHKELSYKLAILENKITNHDKEIYEIFKAIRRLMEPPETKRVIGFGKEKE